MCDDSKATLAPYALSSRCNMSDPKCFPNYLHGHGVRLGPSASTRLLDRLLLALTHLRRPGVHHNGVMSVLQLQLSLPLPFSLSLLLLLL